RFSLVGVVQRDDAKAAAFAEKWGVTAFRSYAELASADIDFAVVSVKAEAHPAILRELHALGLAVLCETPAGLDLAAMLEIWELVQDGLRLHAAEQYLYQPLHAARLALIAAGRLGRVSSARVSAAHGY